MFSIVWKRFLQILLTLSFIFGIFSLISTPLSQIAFWGITWGKLIIFSYFVSSMIIIIQLELENIKRPNIKIKPFISNHIAKLEILNNGGISQFTASAKIVKDHNNILNSTYTLLCERGGYKAEIGKDGIGTIIIADQSLYGSLRMPLFARGKETIIIIASWPTDQWSQVQTDKPPDDIYLEISITTDKKMRKKFSRMVFKLSQESITNLKFEYMESKARKLKLDKDGYLK